MGEFEQHSSGLEKPSSAVETVFEIQEKQFLMEQKRNTLRLETARSVIGAGTAVIFSATALYGIFSRTMETTVVCALIGAATTLLTGLVSQKKGKNDE
jgi:hypothetical protein